MFRLKLKQLLWSGLLIIVTGLTALLMEQTRRAWGNPALSMESWQGLTVDLWFIGLTVQRLALPLVLLFLLSTTRLFERVVTEQTHPPDYWYLLGSLLGIQLLSLVYFSLTENDPVAVFFMVIIALLLGNRWIGLAMALTTFLAVSLQDIITTIWPISETFPDGVAWLSLLLFIIDSVIQYAVAYPILWVGLGGLILVELLPAWGRHPGATFLFGSVVAGGGAVLLAILENWVIDFLLNGALITGFAVAIIVLVVRNVQGQLAQRQAVESELALAQAELRALRAQINPHFFFNALNTIRYFVRTDPQTARGLLLNLSEVFQQALRAGEFISLQEEIHYVEAYLALEQARLDDRLRVRWQLPADDQCNQPIPTLVLQPIVENAVIHGIAGQAKGGMIIIVVAIHNQALQVMVSDDGCGIEAAHLANLLTSNKTEGESIGLRNIDSRLRTLYGEENGLTIESIFGHGTQVSFAIPMASETKRKV